VVAKYEKAVSVFFVPIERSAKAEQRPLYFIALHILPLARPRSAQEDIATEMIIIIAAHIHHHCAALCPSCFAD